MKIIKNVSNNKYLVVGKGFVGSASDATQFSCTEAAKQVEGAKSYGIMVVLECAPVDANIIQNSDGSSFEVHYIRGKDVNADGSIKASKRNPSKRRFKTIDEAKHHGARFVKIEGHVGFFTKKVYAPVTAYVNKVTGFTNPEIGKKRLGR